MPSLPMISKTLEMALAGSLVGLFFLAASQAVAEPTETPTDQSEPAPEAQPAQPDTPETHQAQTETHQEQDEPEQEQAPTEPEETASAPSGTTTCLQWEYSTWRSANCAGRGTKVPDVLQDEICQVPEGWEPFDSSAALADTIYLRRCLSYK